MSKSAYPFRYFNSSPEVSALSIMKARSSRFVTRARDKAAALRFTKKAAPAGAGRFDYPSVLLPQLVLSKQLAGGLSFTANVVFRPKAATDAVAEPCWPAVTSRICNCTEIDSPHRL